MIHCAAGMSRSPAAALVFFAARLGAGHEGEALGQLNRIKTFYLPNARIVWLGDEVLRLGGALWRVYEEAFWPKGFPYDERYTLERLRARS